MKNDIEIVEVRTRPERREFVEYPLRLYKDCPHFVPPLYGDEMKIFTDKNAYADTCETVCFIARKDGKTVGRIQGIWQKQSNELDGEKRVQWAGGQTA